jgi:hypothetical protein
MQEVDRYLVIYERLGDEPIEEVRLSEDEFDTVRRMLSHDASDPMCDCYPLKGDALRRFLGLLGRRPDQDRDYFLESEA